VPLGVGSGTHGQQTARILAAYEEHLLRTPPAAVVVVVGRELDDGLHARGGEAPATPT